MRTLAFTALLCCLAIVAAGCGDDNNSDSGSSGSGQAADTQTTESGGGGGGGAAQTLKLSADPGGALKFDKSSLTAKAGKVTIILDNPSSIPHAVEIEGHGVEEESGTIGEGETTEGHGHCQAGQVRVLLPGRRPQGRRYDRHAHRAVAAGIAARRAEYRKCTAPSESRVPTRSMPIFSTTLIDAALPGRTSASTSGRASSPRA